MQIKYLFLWCWPWTVSFYKACAAASGCYLSMAFMEFWSVGPCTRNGITQKNPAEYTVVLHPQAWMETCGRLIMIKHTTFNTQSLKPKGMKSNWNQLLHRIHCFNGWNMNIKSHRFHTAFFSLWVAGLSCLQRKGIVHNMDNAMCAVQRSGRYMTVQIWSRTYSFDRLERKQRWSLLGLLTRTSRTRVRKIIANLHKMAKLHDTCSGAVATAAE